MASAVQRRIRAFLDRLGAWERSDYAAHDELAQLRETVADGARQARDETILRSAAAVAAANYASRRQPIWRSRPRVVFLVHNVGAWASIDGVVRELLAAPDFDVAVVSIPRRFRGDPGFVGEEDVHEFLARQGIPHLRMDSSDDDQRLAMIRELDPDIVFRQSQWDADIPPALSTESLSFVRTCLIPYEMANEQ